MKAAVLHAPRVPMTIEEIAIEKPKRREVLVRTAAAGICHSDLHFIEGAYPTPLPVVLGHESAGIVEAVGEDVTYLKPGDHVISCLSVFCGHCEFCLTGHPSICQTPEVKMRPGVAKRLTWQGKHLNQFLDLSSFAEQMLVHENALVKVRDDMPLDLASLIGCSVITGYGAVVHTAKVEPGRRSRSSAPAASAWRRSTRRSSPARRASSPSTRTRSSSISRSASARPTCSTHRPATTSSSASSS